MRMKLQNQHTTCRLGMRLAPRRNADDKLSEPTIRAVPSAKCGRTGAEPTLDDMQPPGVCQAQLNACTL